MNKAAITLTRRDAKRLGRELERLLDYYCRTNLSLPMQEAGAANKDLAWLLLVIQKLQPQSKTMKIYAITITDAKTGETHTIETVRSAEEIWCYIDETENEVRSDLEAMAEEQI